MQEIRKTNGEIRRKKRKYKKLGNQKQVPNQKKWKIIKSRKSEKV